MQISSLVFPFINGWIKPFDMNALNLPNLLMALEILVMNRDNKDESLSREACVHNLTVIQWNIIQIQKQPLNQQWQWTVWGWYVPSMCSGYNTFSISVSYKYTLVSFKYISENYIKLYFLIQSVLTAHLNELLFVLLKSFGLYLSTVY